MVPTKQCIGEQMQPDWELTKQQAPETVESLIELIKASLASGGDVLVSGFGKFCVKEKREHNCRNQSTGEKMMLSHGVWLHSNAPVNCGQRSTHSRACLL